MDFVNPVNVQRLRNYSIVDSLVPKELISWRLVRSPYDGVTWWVQVQRRVCQCAIQKKPGLALRAVHQPMLFNMPGKRKVVLIREPAGGEEIEEGTRFSQFILGVGDHRVVFDFTTRVTRLPDQTKAQSAAVVPITMEKRERRK